MTLFDLVKCCYNWDETSKLVLVFGAESVTMTVADARKSFGSSEVVLFCDNVVVLL